MKGNEDLYKIKRITKTRIYPVKEGEKKYPSRCPPSGNNFNYFNPGIGVILKSNLGEKKGSLEYSKLYNRYSTIEFNNILEETLNHNKNKVKNESIILNRKQLKQNILDDNYSNKKLNEISNISFNSSNNSSKIKSYLQNSLSNNLLSDRAYSSNHIIINKSLLGNSSLLDSVDDYENNYESQQLNSLKRNSSCKDFETKNLFDLKKVKIHKILNQEQRSEDLIDRFNVNLVQKKMNIFEYNMKNNNLPNLKPHLPKYCKLIKRNGLWVKSDLPSRIHFGKIPLGIK